MDDAQSRKNGHDGGRSCWSLPPCAGAERTGRGIRGISSNGITRGVGAGDPVEDYPFLERSEDGEASFARGTE